MGKLVDKFNREINYLRVSVTDRCNLRCLYCIPKQPHFKHKDEILTYEEILRIIKVFVELGINKVRITGGEPLVREGIISFLTQLSQIQEIKDLAITTNGILLKRLAKDLKTTGIKRLNISLDTLDEEKFKKITNGKLKPVLDGISIADALRFFTIKINVVVMQGINEDEILGFLKFAMDNNLTIRFIEYMPLKLDDEWRKKYFPKESILKIIEDFLGPIIHLPSKEIASPAKYFLLPDNRTQIGIISPVSHRFCSNCNRLRLTADGYVKTCLLSDAKIDVKTIVKNTQSNDLLKNAILESASLKNKEGNFSEHEEHFMYQVGG